MTDSNGIQTVFWHRDLPPVDAEPIGEHTVEAESAHVPGIIAHGDVSWNACYESLMRETRRRLEQELARLGGDYAHVLHESIDSRRNDALGDAWLHGRFTYVLYRRARGVSPRPHNAT